MEEVEADGWGTRRPIHGSKLKYTDNLWAVENLVMVSDMQIGLGPVCALVT